MSPAVGTGVRVRNSPRHWGMVLGQGTGPWARTLGFLPTDKESWTGVVFDREYLRAAPTAASPQTGVGLPNGLGRRKFHRLTPHAADPWSLTRNLAHNRGAGGGGAAPPRTPLLFRGALRALGCSGWSLFRDRATCPGQLRCLGQNCLQKSDLFLEQATCPGQLRCLGQNFS